MWNSIPNVNLAVLLFRVASTRLSIITQKSSWMPGLWRTPSQLEAHVKRRFQRWDESQRMRGRRTCLLNPEHLFGLCFKRAAGDSGKTSPFSLGLTRIGAADAGLIAHGRRQNQEAGSLVKGLKILTVRTPLITLPQSLWFMVTGVMQGTQRCQEFGNLA